MCFGEVTEAGAQLECPHADVQHDAGGIEVDRDLHGAQSVLGRLHDVFAGYFLCDPSRHRQPAALSALIDTLRLDRA
jgi:hypothetical protein